MAQNQFQFQDTTATRKIFSLTKRIRAVAGGTAASKTISILVWCIDYSQTVKSELISVVSESFPHLEGGAILDFKNLMKDRKYWVEDRWHETKHQYTFETGSVMEFKSIDDYGKAHGPRRDILFVNEANNLSYQIVDQLITRTRKIVWMDWNPSADFWFYSEMLPNRREDIDFITLTYKDNEALDEITIREIESHRDNRRWWTVYGEGKLGDVEGKIYKDWAIIEEVPHEARLERYGLDFGYTNDPTAIVAIYKYNNGFVLNEITFQKGLSNKQIADIFKNIDPALIIADSAEPKSIDEIRSYGLTILPATKGPGSVSQGIQFVQDQRISLTKQSVNIIKEYRNYLWQTDKDGKVLNEPEHTFSHSMDAISYALRGYKTTDEKVRQPISEYEALTPYGI
jgi:phage terminase large subunit